MTVVDARKAQGQTEISKRKDRVEMVRRLIEADSEAALLVFPVFAFS